MNANQVAGVLMMVINSLPCQRHPVEQRKWVKCAHISNHKQRVHDHITNTENHNYREDYNMLF